jgi:hypothetical protein
MSRWLACWKDSRFLRRFHGIATVVWLLASLPCAYLWGTEVVFVTFLSLYAIVTGHWSAWQAARVEEKQDANGSP